MKPVQSMLKIVKKVKWDVAVTIYLAIRKVFYLKYMLYYIVVVCQNEFFMQIKSTFFFLHIKKASPSYNIFIVKLQELLVASLITILT